MPPIEKPKYSNNEAQRAAFYLRLNQLDQKKKPRRVILNRNVLFQEELNRVAAVKSTSILKGKIQE